LVNIPYMEHMGNSKRVEDSWLGLITQQLSGNWWGVFDPFKNNTVL
jgi:hypothetical protein